MNWHFLWERSLLIPAVEDLHFVFSHWLQQQFLSPISIHYLCTGNLRIYIVSDILSVDYHLTYPGKCYNLEQVQPDQRWRWHEDVMTWAMLCRTARDSFASRLEPSQLNVDDKIVGGKTSSGSHFWHIRCDALLVIENWYDIKNTTRVNPWECSVSRRKQGSCCLIP